VLERVGLPERLDSVKVSPFHQPFHQPFPRSLVEQLTRALEASAEQGETSIVLAVRHFAEVLAAHETELLTVAERAALLVTVAGDPCSGSTGHAA